jgi:hypothetical protein
MEARSDSQRWGGLAVLGVLLVVGGIAAFVAREAGWDPIRAVADAGWPLFVIVPGMALLVASLFQRPPHGLGLAIPGGIVAMVGLVLFYQQATGHWESWSYAWALVGPGAAGLATLLYGLLFREGKLIRDGLRLTVISAAIFAVGLWYFETIFDTGRVPIDLAAWWPLVLVALGIAALVTGLVNAGPTDERPSPTTEAGGLR